MGDDAMTVINTVTYVMTMSTTDSSYSEVTTTYSPTLKKDTMKNTTTTDTDGNSHYTIISTADGSTVDYTISMDRTATDDGYWTTTGTTTSGSTSKITQQMIALAYQSALYNVALSAVAAFALLFATLF
jgi:hypothetical protein